MARNTLVRQQDEGDAYWMLGGLYEVKVSGEESGNTLTVMQMTVPEGAGPPPHTHAGEETLYVVDGAVRLHLGEDVLDGPQGSIFHIPAGTLEWFEPVGTARVLITYTPGGVDRFFAEAGEPAQRREIPPPSSTPPDIDRLVQIGARYGVDIHVP